MQEILQGNSIPLTAAASAAAALFVLLLSRAAPEEADPPKGRKLAAAALAAAAAGFAEGLFMYLFYGSGFEAALTVALTTGLLVPVAWCDFKKHLIPNRMLAVALVVRLALFAVQTAGYGSGVIDIAKYSLIAGCALAAAALLCRLVAPKGIGMGDVKLLFVYGLYMGLARIWTAMLATMVVMFICAVTMLVTKKADRNTELPFAPFLLLGTVLAAFLNGV